MTKVLWSCKLWLPSRQKCIMGQKWTFTLDGRLNLLGMLKCISCQWTHHITIKMEHVCFDVFFMDKGKKDTFSYMLHAHFLDWHWFSPSLWYGFNIMISFFAGKGVKKDSPYTLLWKSKASLQVRAWEWKQLIWRLCQAIIRRYWKLQINPVDTVISPQHRANNSS